MDAEFHRALGAGTFTAVNGVQVVTDYGDTPAEHQALTQTAALLDFSFRARLCLTGADRVRFLHGQVTNEIQKLAVGSGCYAALVNAKGRMESDLAIYCLNDELLLDFEAGFARGVMDRLERYIVADDVQVVDVSGLYELLTVQGPGSEEVIRDLGLFSSIPARAFGWSRTIDSDLGELYVANHARLGSAGFDVFVPAAGVRGAWQKLVDCIRSHEGRVAGWNAFEMARIEAGVPRFGVDMDDTNFPQEAGIEARAVSYQKGCYIGQEVLNRIHTMGHVNKSLRGLVFEPKAEPLPARLEKVFLHVKEIGYVTSATYSPRLERPIAMAYIRREADSPGNEVRVRTSSVELPARIAPLPFSLA